MLIQININTRLLVHFHYSNNYLKKCKLYNYKEIIYPICLTALFRITDNTGAFKAGTNGRAFDTLIFCFPDEVTLPMELLNFPKVGNHMTHGSCFRISGYF